LLETVLPGMDAPHKAIHATAAQALDKVEQGDAAGALALIEARRNQELAGLIRLFGEARRIVSEGHREVAILLANGKETLAFATDRVEASEHLPEEAIEPMPASLAAMSHGLSWRVAKRPKTNQTILLLDEDALFAGYRSSKTAAVTA